MNMKEWADQRDELVGELNNAMMRLMLHDAKVNGAESEGKLLDGQILGYVGCTRMGSMSTGNTWYTSVVVNSTDGEKLGMVDLLGFDIQRRVFNR